MNLIPRIAQMLGVELNEVFKIKGDSFVSFKFIGDGLFVKPDADDAIWCVEQGLVLRDLLVGAAEIVKPPFEPKDGERYWTVFWKEIGDMPCAVYETWHGDSCDFANKVSGNCFRTRAEAEAHKYEVYERLTGKKWEENKSE